jgi:lysophospholipase L1-like esterase
MSRHMRRLQILAVQSAIAVLLLEGLLRLHNPFLFRQRGDQIVLPAGQHFVRTNPLTAKLDPVTRYTRNRLGFRGPDVPADFASRLSIVAVGGSTTEGGLLSEGRSWPEQMAAVLARTHPDLWVNNAGFDGHSTFGHLVLLRSVLVSLRPTFMLVLAGINDIGMDGGKPGDEFALAPWLARHSEIANTAINFRRAWRSSEMRVNADLPADLALAPRVAMTDAEVAAELAKHARFLEPYRQRLTALAEESLAAGITPVFLTQPVLLGDAIDPATGADLATVSQSGNVSGRAESRVMERYNDVMRQVAARHGVLLIDLARLLPKDSRYFYDFIHFGNDGARKVGEIVAAELGPHLVR